MVRLVETNVAFVVPVPTEFEEEFVKVGGACANASVGRQKNRQRSSLVLKGTVGNPEVLAGWSQCDALQGTRVKQGRQLVRRYALLHVGGDDDCATWWCTIKARFSLAVRSQSQMALLSAMWPLPLITLCSFAKPTLCNPRRRT